MPIFKKPPFRGNADKKRDMPEGLWHKCPGCGEVIHELELKKASEFVRIVIIISL